VIGDSELPGVRKKNGNDFTRGESSGDKATGKGFDETAIFGEGQAAIAGSVITGRINQRCLITITLATLENDIVNEATCGIGEKLSTKHRW
jgi:hypothetical protein